jgi:hypothetical protein
MALEELNQSNFAIKDGEPDITGWNVLDQNGQKLGEVEDLLFDPEARKVRYLIVGLQSNGDDILADKCIAVPIGVAQLHPDQDEVMLPVSSAVELVHLPDYTNGQLNPEDEVQIRRVFGGGSTAPYEHPQFYTHEHFNEDRFYQRGPQPDNNTIIAAEDMDRTEKLDRIMERIRQIDEEPKASEFPDGKIVGEYLPTTESLERENSQPVEETGNNDYQLNEGFIPEPESIEQEEAWEEETE